MTNREPLLGRRVVVWGDTGSGKTTLARRLSEALDLPAIELDGIRHADGWDSTDWDEFRDILTRRLDEAAGGWVLDGSYSPLHDVYLPRADTLLWLRLPWRVSFARLLRRTVARAWDQKPLYNQHGPHESWRLAFLSRRSILWWSISTHRSRERLLAQRIAALPKAVKVYELRSPQAVAALLDVVGNGRGAATGGM